jgi:hypothetical protein
VRTNFHDLSERKGRSDLIQAKIKEIYGHNSNTCFSHGSPAHATRIRDNTPNHLREEKTQHLSWQRLGWQMFFALYELTVS